MVLGIIYTVTDISNPTGFVTTQQSNNILLFFPTLSAGQYLVTVEDKSWSSFCVSDTILIDSA